MKALARHRDPGARRVFPVIGTLFPPVRRQVTLATGGPPTVLSHDFSQLPRSGAFDPRGTFLALQYGMSTVFSLKEVIRDHALARDDQAFCAALLEQGDILFVVLPYLPECVLWLVSTPRQAWLMRDMQPRAIVFTLGEAADLATTLGDPRPYSLWDVAAAFSAPVSSSRDRNGCGPE